MTFISAVILAGGDSSRFGPGTPKQLADFRGEALLHRVARQVAAASVGEVIVVLGYRAEEVRDALVDLDVRTIDNEAWQSGQSSSLAAGVAAIDPEAVAAIFVPGDQPFVDGDLLERLIRRHLRDGCEICVPTSDGHRGAPVLFARRFFSELEAIEGDHGGRVLLQRYPEAVCEVPLPSDRGLIDVDTQADLEALQS